MVKTLCVVSSLYNQATASDIDSTKNTVCELYDSELTGSLTWQTCATHSAHLCAGCRYKGYLALCDTVGEVSVHGNSSIGRNCPGCRGPDCQGRPLKLLALLLIQAIRQGCDWHGHIYTLGGVAIRVFQLLHSSPPSAG